MKSSFFSFYSLNTIILFSDSYQSTGQGTVVRHAEKIEEDGVRRIQTG